MAPDTQQRILKVLYRVVADVRRALGCDGYDYEQLMQSVCAGVREHGTAVSPLALEWAKRVIPGGRDTSLQPERLDEYLARMDTREKLEAWLLSLPEPDPHWLDLTLQAVRGELPKLRQVLLPFAKRLPHPPGGRRKKLPDPAKRRAIREEIGHLLANKVSLRDAQERLANREGVSVRTIQRIWREAKNG